MQLVFLLACAFSPPIFVQLHRAVSHAPSTVWRLKQNVAFLRHMGLTPEVTDTGHVHMHALSLMLITSNHDLTHIITILSPCSVSTRP